MSRQLTIITPENIPITYSVAGIASRFLAFLIDFLIQILMIIAVSFGFGIVSLATLQALNELLTATTTIISYIILTAYPIFFEMIWGGRTPGKRLLGLRVIRDGGFPINFTSSAIRNFLRPLDFGLIPISPPIILFGFPGLLSIFFSPYDKRMGDWLAGTLVIVDKKANPFEKKQTTSNRAEKYERLRPYIKNLDRLTKQDHLAIRRFIERRSSFSISTQSSLGEYIARPILKKLEINAPILCQLDFADILDALEFSYTLENGLL